MSNSSYSIQIPPNLGARLRVLDRLIQIPQTLGEYGDLLQEYIKKCLREPQLKAYFQEIYKGKKIFGQVDYKTRHRVWIPSGRQVYVACTLDALIEGFFLPIEIDSSCFHCDQQIRIKVSQGTIDFMEPSSTVMWLGASKEGEGPCITTLCPYTNFFTSSGHVDEWRDKNANELGIMLTLHQSLELARKGYWEPLHLLKSETIQT